MEFSYSDKEGLKNLLWLLDQNKEKIQRIVDGMQTFQTLGQAIQEARDYDERETYYNH